MAKRKTNQALPVNADARIITKPCKLSTNEVLELEKKVLYFSKGKWSAYVRAAILNYKPKKEDFI